MSSSFKFLMALIVFLQMLTQMVLAANCPDADPKRVVLFVDTNGGYLEAKAASDAACKRGETFVLLPTSLENLKSVSEKKVIKDRLEYLNWKCSLNTNCNKKDTEKKFLQANHNFEKAKLGFSPITSQILKKELKDYAVKDIAITSLLVSGHDGGGKVSGDLGAINREEILSELRFAYRRKKSLMNELQSVYMWGCYTVTPEETRSWQKNLPGLKILAGFDGRSPSNLQNSSSKLITDIMANEQKLKNFNTEESLKKFLKNFSDLNNTQSAMFIRNCSNENGFYYANRDTIGNISGRFNEIFNCNKEDIQLKDRYVEMIKKYYFGQIAIPINTAKSELRDIYSFTRQRGHCFKRGEDAKWLNSDFVGNLLFFDGLKKNVAKVHAKTLKNADEELRILPQLLETEIAKEKDSISLSSFFLGNQKSDADAVDLKNKLEEMKKKFIMPNLENIKNMDRKTLMDYAHLLNGITRHPFLDSNSELKSKMKSLFHAQHIFDEYFVEANPKCAPFLAWHDYKEHLWPESNCPYYESKIDQLLGRDKR